MVVEDIEEIERKYFVDYDISDIPDMLCTYYENKEFELVYYLSERYRTDFFQCEFYLMMSMMELGLYKRAYKCYKKHEGDWFQSFKQFNIYWKHAAIYSLYFKDMEISDYYWDIFNEYFESKIVQVVELIYDGMSESIQNTELFKNLSKDYPLLNKVWDRGSQKELQGLSVKSEKWQYYTDYNFQISDGDEYGIELVYMENDLEIYSYKPKNVAASMHILRDKDCTIILDCGSEMSQGRVMNIPVRSILNRLNIQHVDFALVSHAHLDHYGSLSELKKTKVFMTEETGRIIKCVTNDVRFNNIQFVEAYSYLEFDDIWIQFIPNGHILGSVLFDINWKDKKRIIYTGDFSLSDQCTVRGLDLKDITKNKTKVDVLLMETTYGDKTDMLTLESYEKIFISLCEKYLKYGNKIFIPCFAVGRTQETAILLAETVRKGGYNIMIDGLSIKVTKLYKKIIDSKRDILNGRVNSCNGIRDIDGKIDNNDVILASSGMMQPGSTAAKYVERLLERENVCIMKVGYINESQGMLNVIKNRQYDEIHFEDISLSAHAGYLELIETVETINPDTVIYVHGRGIVMDEI
ncbi:putative mRNA 3-end processing factor [Acetitomaculum ruminis DSM 5522]|uniref:Putative mRNA 3-end processing factor n=1 Tax=Acetitomaculum ruminis DSM 5522 TaxID=1120918 RepID=A0A1I0WMS5_9FIRM|nr:MBL fold metallo-hydrolase [Acetitomaculum ruminis]SFA89303.1 putative mRNA 3-end processing factor [Acetitomaculum ruminis DSM 5522]